MTDDRLERLRQACEGVKDIKLPALEVLNMVDMIQNYGAEIDRLHEEIGGLIKLPWQVYYDDRMIEHRSADVGVYIKVLEEAMEKEPTAPPCEAGAESPS